MAKFGRFDPRNKKRNRNKINSLQKDIRMHDVEKTRRISGHRVSYVWLDEVDTFDEEFENEDERI